MSTIEEVWMGLKILAQYDSHVFAQHDVIYAGPDIVHEVSGADMVQLKELGWHIDSEAACWARFV